MPPCSCSLINLRRARDIYYPAVYVLPTGQLFMFCDTYGEIINGMTGEVVTPIPRLGGSSRILTQYPYTGASVMLPLLPENDYGVEVMYFGGQYSYGWINTTASNFAWRIKVDHKQGDGSKAADWGFSGWRNETMLNPRVMPDAVLLPNGKVVVLNGAKKGVAGDNAAGGAAKSNEPNMEPELYDPDAPAGKRFSPLQRNYIPRLYHSVAALTVDGTVIVAGCDRCSAFWDTDPYIDRSPWGLPEYRVEMLRWAGRSVCEPWDLGVREMLGRVRLPEHRVEMLRWAGGGFGGWGRKSSLRQRLCWAGRLALCPWGRWPVAWSPCS